MKTVNNNWMHFIGQGLYSIDKFEAEAEKFGVSRNLPKKTLAQMEVGDKVHLFIRDGKSSLMFGHFVVTGLTGEVPAKAADILLKSGKLKKVASGQTTTVERACGSYTISGGYQMNCSIKDVMDSIEESGEDARMMVQGQYVSAETPIRSNMNFYRGFRPFDSEAFMEAWEEVKLNSRPIVKGYFYTKLKELVMAIDPDGNLIEIVNYVKK